MTNEEVIGYLKDIKYITSNVIHNEDERKNVQEALNKAIKALEQTRWIPVSERPPKEDGDYLVTTRWKGSYSGNVYTEIDMAEYRKKSKEWDCVGVVAWMPLPQPYKEEQDGKNNNVND